MCFSNATICENGHIISRLEADAEKFCPECGQPTLSACRVCGTPIRGSRDYGGIPEHPNRYRKPFYCHNCGSAFPWTQKIIDNATAIMSLENVNPELIETMRNIVPGLISDTADTPLSIIQYEKAAAQLPDLVDTCLRELLTEAVSPRVREILFPSPSNRSI